MGAMQGKRILVVDDDPELLALIAQFFSRMQARVHIAAGGEEGLRQFETHAPDLVLLDLMMPDLDGWQVCQQIRQVSDVPIIVLTALSQEEHIVRGLECGADDYVTKPFSVKILLARSQAVLRRRGGTSTGSRAAAYSDGYLTIDLERRRVLVDGERVRLSPTEYGLLAHLFQHAGRSLPLRRILEAVWGPAYGDCLEHVYVYMSRLRQKLERDPKQPQYLLTERGVGYRFRAQAPGPNARGGRRVN